MLSYSFMSIMDTAHVLTQSMICLKTLFNHPTLNREERFVWLWLLSQCVDDVELICCVNYQEISEALGYSIQTVYRALFRLKLMGFLMGEIPIFYGKQFPLEMIYQAQQLKLTMVSGFILDV